MLSVKSNIRESKGSPSRWQMEAKSLVTLPSPQSPLVYSSQDRSLSLLNYLWPSRTPWNTLRWGCLTSFTLSFQVCFGGSILKWLITFLKPRGCGKSHTTSTTTQKSRFFSCLLLLTSPKKWRLGLTLKSWRLRWQLWDLFTETLFLIQSTKSSLGGVRIPTALGPIPTAVWGQMSQQIEMRWLLLLLIASFSQAKQPPSSTPLQITELIYPVRMLQKG